MHAVISHAGAKHVVAVNAVLSADHDTAKVIAQGHSVMGGEPFVTLIRKSSIFDEVDSAPEYILRCPRCSDVLNDADSDEIYCPRGCVI